MTNKKFIKAFVAGLAFPAFFLPLVYTVLFIVNPRVAHEPVQFIPMYIPLLFGLANALYIRMSDGGPAKNVNVGLWTTGAFLGFFVAVIGVFVLRVPTLIFGTAVTNIQFVPLIAIPLIYGVIFRYIVKWLNKTLAV